MPATPAKPNLRTPLTAIDTHLQVARLTRGAQAQTPLQDAEEGVRRLRHTLEQMMTLARADAPIHHSDNCASVRAAVEDVLARIERDCAGRVKLTIDGADSDTPIPRSMLDTSLRNLLDNAIRYSPANSPIALSVRFDDEARQCRIAIADRGPGLSAEQAVQIGQRFWRGDQGRRDGEGAGLGISIVRAIMGRFGGTLELKPQEGGGLSAELRIPIN